MNSKTILVGSIGLIVGLGGGYFLAPIATAPESGTHIMPDGSAMSDSMADMTAGLQGKTGDEFDRAFIEEMIVHHEGAVAMAEAALSSAKHPEIKSMANDIITTQSKEIATMREWLQSWYKAQ